MDSQGLHPSSFLDNGDERGKIIPRQDGGFLAVLEGGAAVDEPRGNSLVGELGAPVVEVGKEVGRDGLAGFDFHGVEGIRIRHQQAALEPPPPRSEGSSAPEIADWKSQSWLIV